MLPTKARITQEWGMTAFARSGAYGGRIHNGMDFGVYYGAWNSPAITLYIISADWDTSGYGWKVRGRDHYGYIHTFAHNSSFLVSPGQTIVIGQPHSISGNSGFSTAPHGHWGVQLPGSTGYNNYINPRDWPGFNEQGEILPYSNEQYQALKDDRDMYAEDWADLRLKAGGIAAPSRDQRRQRLPLAWREAARDLNRDLPVKSAAPDQRLAQAKTKAQEIINL